MKVESKLIKPKSIFSFAAPTFFLFCFSSPLYAAGNGPNFYASIVKWFSPSIDSHEYQVVPGALLVTLLIFMLGYSYKKKTEAKLQSGDLAPSPKVSASNFVEFIVDFVYNLSEGIIGKHFKAYLPLLVPLFLFILLNNLTGLIPGFPPATESFSTNLALGLLVFLAYNFAGVKEHGSTYLKQFAGPFLILAPLIFLIEVISHSSRPLSLALRLYANLFGDHLVVGIFSNLTYIIIPSFLMLFGLLVAAIQSFIFVLLTSIYIAMAESHDH